ncbi:hypothetical protein [Mycoplasma todarodis]|uniref:hypothetical protein n=1 Tax=Mycoplasma todarodis TaxID=1937191 RepID=UPI003B356ED8
MKEKTTLKKAFKITPQRIALLGMFLALLLVFKYAFGFVPGIETTTFLFIIFGIFLPILDLSILIASFNLIIIAIYGVGYWWIMYWLIWPVIAFGSKLISLKIKSIYFFAFWGFIMGMSIGFWYYFLDLAIQGPEYARIRIITALPVNLIEGFTTMFLVVLLAIPIQKVFKLSSSKFYDGEVFAFKITKNPKLAIFITIILALLSTSAIVTIFVTEEVFVKWQNKELRKKMNHDYLPSNGDTPKTISNTKTKYGVYKELDNLSITKDTTPNTGGSMYLTNQSYNSVLKKVKDLPGKQVAIVVIADRKTYTEILDIPNWKSGDKVSTILTKSKRFNFNLGRNNGALYEFGFKGIADDKKTKTNKWGESNKQWDRHFYPLYYINHKYAGLYVNLQNVEDEDILEFSYDHI